MDWIELAQERELEGSCEHDNELLGCIDGWDIFE
jgi:hypothetical protein